MKRIRPLAFLLSCLVLSPGAADAEWQVKPFLGVTFGGDTTFLDLEQASGKRHTALGVSAAGLGDMIGVEADFMHVPGFFQRSGGRPLLVLQSSVTTLTGNVMITLPRRMTEYTLRPYLVGGAGLMHVRADDVLPVATNLATVDVGGGVTGFLTNRVGLSWDVRRFRSVHGKDEGLGISLGAEHLSFWRASMALAIKY